MTEHSFSFDGKNSVDEWGLQMVDYDLLMPPKRSRKQAIPNRSGQYDFGAKHWDERTLRLKCSLLRKLSRAEVREIAYSLSKKGRLRLWVEPEKYYIAELYDPSEVSEFCNEHLRTFELNFVCEPFAYGETVTVPIQNGRNFIDYKGTAETPCVIVLKNTSATDVANITITATKRSD